MYIVRTFIFLLFKYDNNSILYGNINVHTNWRVHKISFYFIMRFW